MTSPGDSSVTLGYGYDQNESAEVKLILIRIKYLNAWILTNLANKLRGNWIKGSISIRQPFTQLTAESNTIWGQFTNEKSNSDFPNNEYIAVDSSGPSSPVVKIHPNEYDSTRYHVAIINPTEQATVDVS